MFMAKKFISQEYTTQTGGRDIKEGTRKSRAGTILATGFFGFAIIIGVSLITFTALFFYSDVDGTSMMRTLNASGVNTDSVLVQRTKEAKRGDIIVVQHYDGRGNKKNLHIKRMIAMEGDTIYFQKSEQTEAYEITKPNNQKETVYYPFFKLFVNGVAYDSDNAGRYSIFADNTADGSSGWMRYSDIYNNFYNWQVGDGTADENVHVLAYHMTAAYRGTSVGSEPAFRTTTESGLSFRSWNMAKQRMELKIPAGYMFYMGDNRGNNDGFGMSSDCTNYGIQPKSHLVGLAVDHASNKSAPEWFFSKVIEFVTFGAVK